MGARRGDTVSSKKNPAVPSEDGNRVQLAVNGMISWRLSQLCGCESNEEKPPTWQPGASSPYFLSTQGKDVRQATRLHYSEALNVIYSGFSLAFSDLARSKERDAARIGRLLALLRQEQDQANFLESLTRFASCFTRSARTRKKEVRLISPFKKTAVLDGFHPSADEGTFIPAFRSGSHSRSRSNSSLRPVHCESGEDGMAAPEQN
jgi:hypothetical protein